MAPPEDIRRSFDEDVDVYDRIRPGYPAELFDALFALLPAAPDVVEVGPGTGQATRDLLDRGASVHAVEIGPAMAARLRANLPSPRLRVTVGDFEEVFLAPASADAVVSATAYHWVSRPAQTDRPAAVLRPGGVVGIIELLQVEAPEDDGFFAAVRLVNDRHGQGHTGPPVVGRAEAEPALPTVLEADPRFSAVTVRRVDWDQTYTAAGYRDLMCSYSGPRMMEEGARLALLDEVEALVRSDFGGRVVRPLVVTLTTATFG